MWLQYKHGLNGDGAVGQRSTHATRRIRTRRVWPDHGPLGFQGSYPKFYQYSDLGVSDPGYYGYSWYWYIMTGYFQRGSLWAKVLECDFFDANHVQLIELDGSQSSRQNGPPQWPGQNLSSNNVGTEISRFGPQHLNQGFFSPENTTEVIHTWWGVV